MSINRRGFLGRVAALCTVDGLKPYTTTMGPRPSTAAEVTREEVSRYYVGLLDDYEQELSYKAYKRQPVNFVGSKDLVYNSNLIQFGEFGNEGVRLVMYIALFDGAREIKRHCLAPRVILLSSGVQPQFSPSSLSVSYPSDVGIYV